tara:strand:- start:149 stop:1138 length:990 start_codon:yes stop_codon:yes gene_type:complete
MKVIVTGGAGFIGSHLTELLIKNKKISKVIVIDHLLDGSKKNIKNILKNKKLTLIKADICNLKSIEKYFRNTNFVFHLAAIADIVPSIVNPIDYIRTNFMGTINVLECSRKYKVKKIIYAASSSCYGKTPKKQINEKFEISTLYPYSFSKNIAEQAIIHWSKVYKLNFISLRLFNVFGTRSRTTGAYGAVMGVFLKQKLSKKPFTVVGNGRQTRDFIYVSDVAEIFEKSAFSNRKNEIFNVGTGKPQTILYLTKLLKGKKIHISKRPGEPDFIKADISKIKRQLKWKPKISFEEGVSQLLDNIDYWKSAPLWNVSKIKIATKNWFEYLK